MAISEGEAIPVAVSNKPLEEEFGLAPYNSNHDAVERVDRLLVGVETVVENPPTVEKGAMTVPKGPGLGVTVDEQAVERYRTDT